MAVVRKKQDDKHLKTLRETVSLGGNKQCFDCGQRGPTYVNMTIGSFVCTRCSGLLRGITPPHRVKSISMATFSSDEIEFVRSHGNDICAKTWLGLWDPKRVLTQDQRDLMVEKYERKRYFLEPASPLKSLPQHTSQIGIGSLLNGLHNNNIAQHHQLQQQQHQQQAIALTPPASTRNASKISSQHQSQVTHQFHTQFSPDEQPSSMAAAGGGLMTAMKAPGQSNGHHGSNGNSPGSAGKSSAKSGTTNGFTRLGMSGLTGSPATNGDRSAARLSGPPVAAQNNNNNNNNNNNGNKFSPDGDFGSDFGALGGAKAAAEAINGQQQQQQRSGGDNANANFADFEHNAIFNAADYQYTAPQLGYHHNLTKLAHNANCGNVWPTAAAAPAAAPTNQWNVWQQFQLQALGPTEQNRWSLPMSLSSNNGSLNSSGSTPFNSSSSSINSTPPVDRYAALKDLDMQLREVVKDTGLFSSSTGSSSTSSSNNNNGGGGVSNGTNGAGMNGNNGNSMEANPFKAHAHQQLPFGAAAQQPVINPFQSAAAVAAAHGQPKAAGGGGGQQQQQQSWATDFGNATFDNGRNGFGGMSGNNGQHHAGFGMQANAGGMQGFGMMQRNPFAATTTGGGAAVRSNNPFL